MGCNQSPDKIDTPVSILDYKDISFDADGSNRVIKFDVLVTFCILIDSLVILSLSEIGATKFSFDSSILSLGDYESLIASSSSKSSLDFSFLLFGNTK